MNILLVEDENDIAQTTAAYLEMRGYNCDIASSGSIALEKIDKDSYDCILLDANLANSESSTVLDELKRRNKEDCVVLMPAHDSPESRPSNLAELTSKINSITQKEQDRENIVRINDVTIDMLAKKAQMPHKEVHFTNKEMELLTYLINNKGKIVSKNILADHLSGNRNGESNNYDLLYAHIKNLKKKLHEAGCERNLRTIYGSGYKWETY